MTLPLVVAPSNPSPGFRLRVNLLAATLAAGSTGYNVAIMGMAETSVGDMTADTEIRTITSDTEAAAAAGKGPLYRAWQTYHAIDPTQPVDFIKVTESAGAAAAQTLTFAGTPTADCSWDVFFHGYKVTLSWLVGQLVATARDNGVTQIASYTDNLACTAAAGSGGVINLTARSKGPWGNDITLRVKQTSGAGATLTAGAATFAGGTTEPDFTNALATANTKEYDMIIPCLSQAETVASGTTNVKRVDDNITAAAEGLHAKLQQFVVGSRGSVASAKTGAVARNSVNGEHFCVVNAEDLPCELAAAEAADRIRRRKLEINANRCGSRLPALSGSATPTADNPTEATAIDALNNGVTIGGYDAQGNVIVLRPITMHSQDSSGAPDKRCFDVNEVDSLYDYGKYLRTYLPQKFMSADGAQVKVQPDRPEDGTADELPEGVVEERDILAAIVTRTRDFWVPKGVISGPDFEAALEAKQVQVKVNPSDAKQVDIYVPAKAVPILAKMGLYLAKVG